MISHRKETLSNRIYIETLNKCLRGSLEWMVANKLKFNPNKMEVPLLSRRSDPGFKVLLWVPHFLRLGRVAIQECDFSVTAQKPWNSLPKEICLSPPVAIICQHVKMF